MNLLLKFVILAILSPLPTVLCTRRWNSGLDLAQYEYNMDNLKFNEKSSVASIFGFHPLRSTVRYFKNNNGSREDLKNQIRLSRINRDYYDDVRQKKAPGISDFSVTNYLAVSNNVAEEYFGKNMNTQNEVFAHDFSKVHETASTIQARTATTVTADDVRNAEMVMLSDVKWSIGLDWVETSISSPTEILVPQVSHDPADPKTCGNQHYRILIPNQTESNKKPRADFYMHINVLESWPPTKETVRCLYNAEFLNLQPPKANNQLWVPKFSAENTTHGTFEDIIKKNGAPITSALLLKSRVIQKVSIDVTEALVYRDDFVASKDAPHVDGPFYYAIFMVGKDGPLVWGFVHNQPDAKV